MTKFPINSVVICPKCNKIIDIDYELNIICDSICGYRFHKNCTNLSDEQIKFLNTISNLSWKCDSCLLLTTKTVNGSQIHDLNLKNVKKNLYEKNNFENILQVHELRFREFSKRLSEIENVILQNYASGSKAKNSPTIQPEKPFSFIRKRKAIIITTAIVILTLLIGLITYFCIPTESKNFYGDGEDSRKNIPINSTIEIDDDADEENRELLVMSREDWGAREPTGELDKLNLPVRCIIISHTVTKTCMDKDSCSEIVRSIQNDHINSKNMYDIGFNYLIGGDGYVYIGRSWNKQGAHTKSYNADSIGISFIGTFTTIEPTKRQIQAAKLLIDEAVLQQKIVPDFCIYGARQFRSTESPGEAVYRIIKTWPHWSQTIKCRKGA